MATIRVFIVLGDEHLRAPNSGQLADFLASNSRSEWVNAPASLPNGRMWNVTSQVWQDYTGALSNTMSSAVGSDGPGPEWAMAWRVRERTHTADDIRIFKWVRQAPLGDDGDSSQRWGKVFAESYGEALDAWTQLARPGIGAAEGVDIEVTGFIVSLGDGDVLPTPLASYKANVEAFVSSIRTDYTAGTQTEDASTVPVMWFEPIATAHASAYPNAVTQQRLILQEVQAADPSFYLVSTDDLAVQDETVDLQRLDMIGTTRWGERVADAYANSLISAVPATGGPLPIVLYAGGDHLNGTVDSSFLTTNLQTTEFPSHVRIWNEGANAAQTYDPASNSNTWGNADVSHFGPDVTLMEKLQTRYPDGFLLVKAGETGSSLGSSGARSWQKTDADLWTDLSATVDKVNAWCHANGFLPDWRDIIWQQWQGDAGTMALADGYQAALELFLGNVRALVNTRVGGEGSIHCWIVEAHRDPQDGVNDAQAGTIRSAQKTAAGNLANATLVSVAQSRFQVDRVHFTGEGLFDCGDQIGDAMNGETTAATPTEETYASVSESDGYFLSVGGNTTWSDATSAEKVAALVAGTRYLEVTYSGRWRGTKSTTTQELAWPRTAAYDVDDNLIEGVPTATKHANAEAALRALTGDLIPDVTSGAVESTKIKVGQIEEQTTYLSGSTQTKVFTVIDRLVAPLTQPVGLVRA